ncbi:aspartate:alanine exchanger family transporter [Aureibacter tunicatorum]|uniref:Transport protein n=1 Tax=Aureibacter tunicatorum TaxID=866807 RepID=A0AAE4BQS1_9BACT|nr:TrkA C-terminal domain-containing protein [Aureibacter tunicatorum]MDR6239469.1 putative transport protein [Aureibacter tunicatorum]BDD04609.1 putative transporter [Aureibacter tunicatorum]
MDFTSLFHTEYFALFMIISIGILIGRIEVKGISLDVSAVIFVALLFGHFGITISPIFKTIGLLLFILTIGIQAGPGFFDSFKSNGLKLVMIAGLIVISGATTATLLALLMDVDLKYAVGIFSGALTSTPGLAAAIEATKGSSEASIGYGIAYPFGVIGVILFVRLSPKIFKIDLKKEAEKFRNESSSNFPKLFKVNFIVENERIFGKTLKDLDLRRMTGANVSRVKHGEEIFVPMPDTVLHEGDRLRLVGSKDAIQRSEHLIGRVIEEEIPKSDSFDVDWVLVTNKAVVNKTLAQLALLENYNATITRIRRAGIDITATPNSQIKFGDKLMVVSNRTNTASVRKFLGDEPKKLNGVDFLPIAASLVLGIILGKVDIPLFGSSFKLGLTGGVLIVSLLLSRLGKTGPIIWNVSGPVNATLRQFGLLLFLAAVGTSAGTSLMETIASQGPKLFLIGFAATMVPMVLSIMLGYYVFKVNFLSLLGALTGGMTSTPGLSALDPMTDSNAPSIAYATVYPFAMVILIICAQIVGYLSFL